MEKPDKVSHKKKENRKLKILKKKTIKSDNINHIKPI